MKKEYKKSPPKTEKQHSPTNSCFSRQRKKERDIETWAR